MVWLGCYVDIETNDKNNMHIFIEFTHFIKNSSKAQCFV